MSITELEKKTKKHFITINNSNTLNNHQFLFQPEALCRFLRSTGSPRDTWYLLYVVSEIRGFHNSTVKRNSRCFLYWIQVSTIVILLIAAVVGDVYIWWKFIAKQKLYYILNLSAYIILDFVSLMHLMYTQCLALVIADHFNELACRVKNEPYEPDLLQTVNTIWDDLEHYKQRIIATFGVMNVLHALDALVKCAVETYVIFSTWEMGFGLLGAFLDIITLTVYAATFFIFAFAHDRVEVKVSASNCCFKHPSRTCQGSWRVFVP